MLDVFVALHIASGINPIRILSEGRPDRGDLITDPQLWEQTYFEHRDEIIARFGPDCPAAQRFEPDLEQDDEEIEDEDADAADVKPTFSRSPILQSKGIK